MSGCKVNNCENHSSEVNQSIYIISLNVCGLKSKLFTPEFVELCSKHDIICLSEIKCDEVDMKNVVEFFEKMQFTVIYSVRKVVSAYKSGGIMIAVKHEMKPHWKPVRRRSEAFISLHLDKACLNLMKDVVITAVYIPPSNSRFSSIELFEELDNFLLDYNDDDYYHIVCGDFNAHTGTYVK